jgi:proline iminopeptidase
MRSLYPEIEPYCKEYLKVSDLHSLYYEECGNPDGQAVVFLHGGPGAGVVPAYRRFFDPAFYRIVLFDQRGAGQSRPYASLEENTTWDLITDIERLRQALGIQRWLVFGGSWGSTLALQYAIHHPASVTGLILRGIYLGRGWENRWLYQQGASFFFPELWQSFIEIIPAAERGEMIHAYHQRLTSTDPTVRLAAANRWADWENAISRLVPEPHPVALPQNAEANLAIARIECHYFVNNLFLPSENSILEQVSSIKHIPTRIIHGRYDLICPVRSAFELADQLPQADLRVIPNAGHASLELPTSQALVQATEDFKKLS